MKVYCETPPDLSKAMGRVVAALKREAPHRKVEFVNDPEAAELVILHVIGFPETEAAVAYLNDMGKRYAIIQYCMRSTQRPDTKDWKAIWERADMVWSYYDLPEMVRADGGKVLFHFYCAPMGVDPVFLKTEPKVVKMWTLMTTGYVAASESITEAGAAVRQINGRWFHLGPRDAAPKADMLALGIGDFELADAYSRTCWVSGLRRAEGFEMPAAEGLVCGARPIVFDAPHYRRWYDGLAEFIPEGSPDEVTQAILEIFARGYSPVTEEEIRIAQRRFDWKKIIPGFWEGVLG